MFIGGQPSCAVSIGAQSCTPIHIREQASADAERAQAALDHAGNQAVSLDMVKNFARAARQRIRLDGGGYHRDHLRALAQRIEVADREVRIMGSKSELLRTLGRRLGREIRRSRCSEFSTEMARHPEQNCEHLCH